MRKKGFKCVLCKEWALGWGPNRKYGNNPDPLAQKGQCCDECNVEVVSARIREAQRKMKERIYNAKKMHQL